MQYVPDQIDVDARLPAVELVHKSTTLALQRQEEFPLTTQAGQSCQPTYPDKMLRER